MELGRVEKGEGINRVEARQAQMLPPGAAVSRAC